MNIYRITTLTNASTRPDEYIMNERHEVHLAQDMTSLLLKYHHNINGIQKIEWLGFVKKEEL